MGELVRVVSVDVLAQWRESARLDLAEGRTWSCHPAAILEVIDRLERAEAQAQAFPRPSNVLDRTDVDDVLLMLDSVAGTALSLRRALSMAYGREEGSSEPVAAQGEPEADPEAPCSHPKAARSSIATMGSADAWLCAVCGHVGHGP